MKKTTLVALILCATLALPAQAGFKEGVAAHKRGHYATVLKPTRAAGLQGSGEVVRSSRRAGECKHAKQSGRYVCQRPRHAAGLQRKR